MSEQLNNPGLPSGYEMSRSLPEPLTVGQDSLPWLKEPAALQVAECKVQGGESFYLASAIGTSDKLTKAAEGLTEDQRRITDNMFYSRLQGFLDKDPNARVEQYPNAETPFPIFVFKNKGGQRVYFGSTTFQPEGVTESKQLIIRLAVCDKNRQGLVFPVLGTKSDGQMRRSTSK